MFRLFNRSRPSLTEERVALTPPSFEISTSADSDLPALTTQAGQETTTPSVRSKCMRAIAWLKNKCRSPHQTPPVADEVPMISPPDELHQAPPASPLSKLWQWIIPKLPKARKKETTPATHQSRFFTVGAYARYLLQQIVRITAVFGGGLVAAYPSQLTPYLWGYIAPFAVAAALRRAFHRDPDARRRFAALLSSNAFKLFTLAPALLSIGSLFFQAIGANTEAGSPAMVANFFTALGLSFVYFIVEKRKHMVQQHPAANTLGKPAKIKLFLKKIPDASRPLFTKFIMPITEKLGVWNYLRKGAFTFTLALMQQLGFISQTTYTLPFPATELLYAFLALPVALQLLLSSLGKCGPAHWQRRISNASIGFNALTDGAFAFIFIDLLLSNIVGSYQEGFLSDIQVFYFTAITVPVGIFMIVFSALHALEKRRNAWTKYDIVAWTDGLVSFVENTLYIKLDPRDAQSLLYAVIDPNG